MLRGMYKSLMAALLGSANVECCRDCYYHPLPQSHILSHSPTITLILLLHFLEFLCVSLSNFVPFRDPSSNFEINMDGSKSKGKSVKRVAVRANKAQTVILQDAFTRSNAASPEELKTLSEKTGLYVFSLYHPGQAFDAR